MKRIKQKRVAIGLALASFAVLSGCGQSSVSPPPGSIGSPLPGGVAGCIPLGSPIGFQGTGVYWDGISIRAGQVPDLGNQQFGTMQLYAGGAGGPLTSQGSPAGGTLSMTLTPGAVAAGGYQGYPTGYQWPNNNMPYPSGYMPQYYGAGTNATISGTITVSPNAVSIIQAEAGGQAYGGYGFYAPGVNPWAYPNSGNVVTPGQICINQVALWAIPADSRLQGVLPNWKPILSAIGYIYVQQTTAFGARGYKLQLQ